MNEAESNLASCVCILVVVLFRVDFPLSVSGTVIMNYFFIISLNSHSDR